MRKDEEIWNEEMWNLMMHMIGYGDTAENLIDAMNDDYYNFDEELIFELARWCDERWGTNIVEAIKRAKGE